jgi:hypothetical protein
VLNPSIEWVEERELVSVCLREVVVDKEIVSSEEEGA